MKVIHLCASDLEGGAARASYRLHNGLRTMGVESFMLVGKKLSNDHTVYPTARSKIQELIDHRRMMLDSIPLYIYRNRSQRSVFFPTWVPEKISLNPLIASADIVNLHWVSGGFLRPESLRKFNKPIVWRLSDMWAFTGGCHYAGECANYEHECGKCPQLGSQRKSDISHWLWKRKERSWRSLNLTIVTPSRWLSDCAKKSSLFCNLRVEVIHNGIDINKYKPADKMFARQLLDLPLNKRLILFGAINVDNDKRKGYDHLKEALKIIASSPLKNKVEIVIFGSYTPNETPDFGLPIHYLGYLHDNISLAICYSAADVFVAPSTEDNFPSTILESLACATPVVAFKIGGIPDLVEHKENGYLAAPFDENDIAYGIKWILEHDNQYVELTQRARKKVLDEFTMEIQAYRYLKLYNEILNQ